MANENLKDQINQMQDKVKECAASTLHEGEKEMKDLKDKFQTIACSVDKHVRDNPWPAVAGAVASGLLLGFILGNSRKG